MGGQGCLSRSFPRWSRRAVRPYGLAVWFGAETVSGQAFTARHAHPPTSRRGGGNSAEVGTRGLRNERRATRGLRRIGDCPVQDQERDQVRSATRSAWNACLLGWPQQVVEGAPSSSISRLRYTCPAPQRASLSSRRRRSALFATIVRFEYGGEFPLFNIARRTHSHRGMNFGASAIAYSGLGDSGVHG